MNPSEFFIKKPVFCSVLAIFLVILGFLSLKELPLRQFPDIERSEITIDTLYSGAASEIIEIINPLFNKKSSVDVITPPEALLILNSLFFENPMI